MPQIAGRSIGVVSLLGAEQAQKVMQMLTKELGEEVISQFASAAEELSAVTEQTSAGVNSQKIETDQVATAMHEMTATVQEVARNAEQASQAAAAAQRNPSPASEHRGARRSGSGSLR